MIKSIVPVEYGLRLNGNFYILNKNNFRYHEIVDTFLIMKKLILIAPFLVLALLISACKKDKKNTDTKPSDPTGGNEDCGTYLYKDSSFYTGNNSGTVVTYYVYKKFGELQRLDYYTGLNRTSFDSIFYSAQVSGRIDSLIEYNVSGNMNTPSGRKRLYTYTDGNLTKIETATELYTFAYTSGVLTNATFPISGITATVSNIVFSNGNIVSATLDPDGPGGTMPAPVSISYDSKPNFAKQLKVSTDVFQLFSTNNYLQVSAYSIPLVTNTMTYKDDLADTRYMSTSLSSDTQRSFYFYKSSCK